MKCPKCGTTKGLKWFLRHQTVEQENGENLDANVITVLCTECGENDSLFLQDYLEDLFVNWREIEEGVFPFQPPQTKEE